MRRVWLTTKKEDSWGFSVIEVLLAATVFGFLTVALVGAFIYGRSGTASAGDRARAVALAEEGLEAVRNIRDSGYSNLADGAYGLVATGNPLVWELSGPFDVVDTFLRQITIADDGSNRKLITSTVYWWVGPTMRQTSVQTRMSDWSAAIPPPEGPIMMVYAKNSGANTPYFRTWNGSSWSNEGSASGAASGIINYVALKSSRKRNEAVLAYQDANGRIYFRAWSNGSWGSATQIGTGPTATRGFDIAYENSTNRAIVAYSTGADFAYRIWDGNTLSSPTTVTAPPTTGTINWIEMRQNSSAASNEIAFILLDSNNDVYGMRWTGSAWDNMGTGSTWDTTASSGARKGIDVDYEQDSSNILFAWADQNTDVIMYRTWDGSSLSNATALTVSNMNGAGQWLQLAARPGSDEIMLGVQDSANDLNTRVWTGSGWDAAGSHPEHDDSLENVNSRNFDIVWETHPSNPGVAWVLWGDGSTISSRRWSGSSWGSVSTLSGSQDTSFVRLRADPISGVVFTGNYQNFSSGGANRDISSRELTGGGSTWSAKNVIWGGATTSDPVYFRIDIATP